MAQPQQQQQQQMQSNTMAGANPPNPAAANAFPGYGTYPGMNPAAPTGGYYTPGAQQTASAGQQNPAAAFPGGYQNYQYAQQAGGDN